MSNLYWIKSTYNYNTGNSKLTVSKNYEDLPTIHQLDALQDAIIMLTNVKKDLKRLIIASEKQ